MRLPGKGTHLYVDILSAGKLLTRGTVISIDPSVGSTSSLPAYAVYELGTLVHAEEIDTDVGAPLHTRLQNLSRKLRSIYKRWNPDVLVYENVAPQRYGGGNAEAHASLLKAVGVILSVPGPIAYVRASPIVWKKYVRSNYVKGDIQDAIEIGWIVTTLAREMSELPERDSSRGRGRGSKGQQAGG